MSILAQASLPPAGTATSTAKARPLLAAGVFQRSEVGCAIDGLSMVSTVAREWETLCCDESPKSQQLRSPCTVMTTAASVTSVLEMTLTLCSGPLPNG